MNKKRYISFLIISLIWGIFICLIEYIVSFARFGIAFETSPDIFHVALQLFRISLLPAFIASVLLLIQTIILFLRKEPFFKVSGFFLVLLVIFILSPYVVLFYRVYKLSQVLIAPKKITYAEYGSRDMGEGFSSYTYTFYWKTSNNEETNLFVMEELTAYYESIIKKQYNIEFYSYYYDDSGMYHQHTCAQSIRKEYERYLKENSLGGAFSVFCAPTNPYNTFFSNIVLSFGKGVIEFR